MGGVWILPVNLPIRHHLDSHHHHHNNHNNHNHHNYNNHSFLGHHNYHPGIYQLHPGHLHHGGLQHLRLQLHRAVRLQHAHLHGHHKHDHDHNNHNNHHDHSCSVNMLSVLRTCSRTVLCLPLHLRRNHILRLCRVGIWR